MTKEEEQVQLKEIYNEISREENFKEEELSSLKNEFNLINKLLDSYGIARAENKMKLSLIERIEIALKQRLFA